MKPAPIVPEDRYVIANTELFCLSTVSNTHHYSFLTWIMIDDAWIALEYYTDGTSLCIYVLSWSNKPSNRLSYLTHACSYLIHCRRRQKEYDYVWWYCWMSIYVRITFEHDADGMSCEFSSCLVHHTIWPTLTHLFTIQTISGGGEHVDDQDRILLIVVYDGSCSIAVDRR